MATRTPNRATLSGGRDAYVVVAGAIALAVCAWRITIGASLGDDAHVIAFALRMARGDLPFADEMDVQSLGSLWAVPFTWLWIHLVGLDGLVIAARAFYVVFAFGAAAVAYRALRVSFGPLTAATAVALPLLAPPYNLLNLSYNTSPIALGVVALAAAHAATAPPGMGSTRRWAAVAGAASVGAVLSNPVTLPGGVALAAMVGVLARRRTAPSGRLLVAYLLAAATVCALALALFLTAGVDAIRATLDYASGYRSFPRSLPQRLGFQLEGYLRYVGRPVFLPAVVAVLLGCLPGVSRPGVPRRLRALALAVAAVAVVVPSFLAHDLTGVYARSGTRPAVGTLPAVALVVLAVALVAPVALDAVRGGRGDVRRLLVLGLVPALPAVPAVATGTLSAPNWGAVAVAAAPAVTAVVAGWADLLEDAWRGLARVASAVLGALVLALLVLTPFRDAAPWHLHARIRSGAYAGVLTSRATATQLAEVTRSATRWLRPGDGILFYGLPGAYVLVDARADSNLDWLMDYGPANGAVLTWFARTGRYPQVVVFSPGLVHRPTSLAGIARRDPLVAFFLRGYRVVQTGGTRPTVLVRR